MPEQVELQSVYMRADFIRVPIPLHDGTAAILEIPKVLRPADADKIARVVKAMAYPAPSPEKKD